MPLQVYEDFINQTKEKLLQDHRFLGLLAGGSMTSNTMDEYSDLDLIVVYDAVYREDIMNQRVPIAEKLGNLLSGFTGEHVGEPRLLICLYGPPPLHVDMKFVTVQELEQRVEDPMILWERDKEISARIERTSPIFPYPSSQWIEDRFWVWVHYGATKLGRGELFELIDHLTFMRNAVLGPLFLIKNGELPAGVRRLEKHVSEGLEELKETIPSHSRESCYHALQMTIRLYQQLRQDLGDFEYKSEAEQVSVAYLESVYFSIHE
ncbi:nucleotidyltransferase domain-containing protein [Paenibacillus qinlingensis]|uniref:nucleotidyltransferase domain-containing protein n=1 Tax=Paenibacillus qinlingensis TaxID=1837343 RepID=UPI0015640ED0|nr:nucleotidyltransferase domain-containing protein [Paenibacillus qinlingensis]NQX62735.1 nucleotidyltransferase domain-containing protein [Paenibacillus qinlingensis]